MEQPPARPPSAPGSSCEPARERRRLSWPSLQLFQSAARLRRGATGRRPARVNRVKQAKATWRRRRDRDSARE
uniref:Uncharacterized protein n=1 Tax=Sphaerodactylus townsendi TaxID=933632 RepID=A0ACB8E5A0_9SAUR